MGSLSIFVILSVFFATVHAQLDSDSNLIELILGNLGPPLNVTITRANVTFYLYSWSDSGTVLTFDNLDILDPSLPTVVLIHGFADNSSTFYYEAAIEAYLGNQDYNIIAVDYQDVSYLPYSTAVSLIDEVGFIIADLLVQAHTNYGISLATLTVEGHSLGAQVSGYVGRSVRTLTGSPVNRLTGLDPAGPLFSTNTNGIRSGDGALVVCIHTNAGLLGTTREDCDLDFSPYGGGTQPGCSATDVNCNHARAVYLHVESIQNPLAFLSVQCGSYIAYSLNLCRRNRQVTLGGNLTPADIGTYYFRTNSQYPYSLN